MKIKDFILKFKDLFLYLIVGVIATLTEWIIFYCFENMLPAVHYNIATSIAYVISTFVNWLAGRLIVFKESNQSVFKELVKIYLTSIVGLLLNLAIMYVCVDLLTLDSMLSKIIATGIVFFFNFLVRKLFIYKKQG